jgi:hypothetical protein
MSQVYGWKRQYICLTGEADLVEDENSEAMKVKGFSGPARRI